MRKRREWLFIPILALLLGPAARADNVEQIEEDYHKAERKFFEGYDPERGKDVDWAKHPAKEFLPKFKTYAEGNEDADDVVQALVWVLRLAQMGSEDGKEDIGWAMDRLAKNHVADPKIVDALHDMQYMGWHVDGEKLIPFYENVVKKNKNKDAVAAATFNLAYTHYQGARHRSRGPLGILGGSRKQRKRELAKARELFQKVADDYKDTDSAERAAGYVYELDHLQIGMKAPEIVGKDADGKEIKLSDFKGKVVVIDFWGFW